MSKINIPKKILLDMEIPYGNCIEDRIIDNSRWSIHHEVIFEYEGKIYRAYYSVGATELQDEGPWEYDDDVVCTEVHKIKEVVEVWSAVG